MSQGKRYLSKSKTAQRYDKTPRTIDRWDANPPPYFPKPVMINGRKHWEESALEEYERVCAASNSNGEAPRAA